MTQTRRRNPVARPELPYYFARAGLLHVEVAERLGVHPHTVSQWVRGRRPTPLPELRQRMAEVLGCSEAELFPDIYAMSDR